MANLNPKLCECGCGQSVSRKFLKGHNKRQHRHSAGGKITPTYQSWMSMRRRCDYPHSSSYSRYGGRGIRVCDRWQSFSSFLEDMGERPRGKTLDRINNDGNYEPSNCRWATASQQLSNQQRTHFVTAFGRTQTVSQWADEIGITHEGVAARLKRMPAEAALSTPSSRVELSATAFGRTQSLKAWARETGIKYNTLFYRIELNSWDAETALSRPVRGCAKGRTG